MRPASRRFKYYPPISKRYLEQRREQREMWQAWRDAIRANAPAGALEHTCAEPETCDCPLCHPDRVRLEQLPGSQPL